MSDIYDLRVRLQKFLDEEADIEVSGAGFTISLSPTELEDDVYIDFDFNNESYIITIRKERDKL